MPKRTLAGTVGVLCLVLAASGCSADDPKSPGPRDTAAPTASSPALGAPADEVPGPTPEGGSTVAASVGRTLSGTRDKVTTARTCKARITLEMDGLLLSTARAEMRLGGGGVTRMVTVTDPAHFTRLGARVPSVEERTTESLYTADAAYSSIAPSMREYYDGKSWTKVVLGTGTADSQSRPQDFSSQLALLQKSGDIREVGRESVGGIATTHYAGTVSLLLLQGNSAESMGVSQKDYEMLRKIWEAMGFDNATIDLWVGPDALPVKQVTKTTLKREGAPGTMTTTVVYSDWGAPIDDAPPPAEATTEITLPPSAPNHPPASPEDARAAA